MGVDQVVEVEMVGADGSLIVANGEKENFKRSSDKWRVDLI